jgi:hypothetical protein
MKHLITKLYVKAMTIYSLAKSIPYYRILIVAYIALLVGAFYFGGWLAMFILKLLA